MLETTITIFESISSIPIVLGKSVVKNYFLFYKAFEIFASAKEIVGDEKYNFWLRHAHVCELWLFAVKELYKDIKSVDLIQHRRTFSVLQNQRLQMTVNEFFSVIFNTKFWCSVLSCFNILLWSKTVSLDYENARISNLSLFFGDEVILFQIQSKNSRW